MDELITRMRALGTGGSSRAHRADGSSDANDAAGDGEGAAGDVDMDMGMSARLAKMRAQGDVLEPGPTAGVSHSSSMFLTAALDAQMCGTFGFTQCVHMDEERVPVVRRTHSQRMWGAVMGSYGGGAARGAGAEALAGAAGAAGHAAAARAARADGGGAGGVPGRVPNARGVLHADGKAEARRLRRRDGA